MNKKHRIQKNEEFASILSLKNRFINEAFILYVAPKKEDGARFGISVSKKMGKAVVRNHIKRQIRMMVQEEVVFEEYPYDTVIIVRKDYLDKTYDEDKKCLAKALKMVKIKKKTSRSIN